MNNRVLLSSLPSERHNGNPHICYFMKRRSRRTAPLPKSTRPPYERMVRIHHALQAEKYPNCSSLTQDLDVSGKTIQRDLDFMRDRLNLPITFSPAKRGFHYTEAVDQFPLVEVTESEVLAFFVAQKVLAQYQGTPFARPLARAFEKLTAALQGSVTFPLVAMDDTITFKLSGTVEMDADTFRILHSAIVKKLEIKFRYRKRSSDDSAWRTVQPYFIHGALNGWYLIAYDCDRADFRTFAIQRIREIRKCSTRFERKTDVTPESLLKSSLGTYLGEGHYDIRIRFDKVAAGLVRERNWHASEKKQELPNGELELSMVLGSLFEAEQWVLSWGRHATVITPTELRQSIRNHVEQLQKRYVSDITHL